MNNRTPLRAKEGYALTDGKIYGKIIYLAESESADAFYEIPVEEAEKIMAGRSKTDELHPDNC